MAKCGVTNIGGGGGIGSDELSVTKEYVLSGKTYVGADTDDEIGTGTMENNGATTNQTLNAGGAFTVKKGYHSQAFNVTANSLASQTSGTATAGQILSGQTAWVNGGKLTGTVPIQYAEVGGDQVWATNYTTWGDGNVFFGVRNGYYLNGVNWIRRSIPNFTAGNIKKGVDVGGVVGTFEGYVPGAQDLYYRGNNVVGFTGGGPYEAGQLVIGYYEVYLTANFNLVGRNYLNINGIVHNGNCSIQIQRQVSSSWTTAASGSFPGNNNDGSDVPYTYSVALSGAQISGTIRIKLYCLNGIIFRIWLS